MVIHDRKTGQGDCRNIDFGKGTGSWGERGHEWPSESITQQFTDYLKELDATKTLLDKLHAVQYIINGKNTRGEDFVLGIWAKNKDQEHVELNLTKEELTLLMDGVALLNADARENTDPNKINE